MHERGLAYTALGGLLAVFVAQALVASQSGAEPYPSLAMPGFHGGGVPATADLPVTAVMLDATTRDGRVLTIDPQDLLAGTPPATVVAVINYLYRDGRWNSAAPFPEASHWLPGRAITVARDRDTGLALRTRGWLRARLAARFPHLSIAAVRVRREIRRIRPEVRDPAADVTLGTLMLDAP